MATRDQIRDIKQVFDDIREAANDGPAGFVPASGVVKVKLGSKEKARYVDEIVDIVDRAVADALAKKGAKARPSIKKPAKRK